MKKEDRLTAAQPLEIDQPEGVLTACRGQKGAVSPLLQKA